MVSECANTLQSIHTTLVAGFKQRVEEGGGDGDGVDSCFSQSWVGSSSWYGFKW